MIMGIVVPTFPRTFGHLVHATHAHHQAEISMALLGGRQRVKHHSSSFNAKCIALGGGKA